MSSLCYASIAISVALCIFVQGAGGANFEIINQCPYTVWAAGYPQAGGLVLQTGQSWTMNIPSGSSGRFWGRTGCSANGTCQTGDCNGQINCQMPGQPPATLVEYTLNGSNNLDFFDISLVDGFNLPLSLTPSAVSGDKCRRIACLADINSVCPPELKVSAGGCNSACNAFRTDQYCCNGTFVNNCPPTQYSQFYKNLCPDAYSYAKDDPSSTFTCPTGVDYNITCCG